MHFYEMNRHQSMRERAEALERVLAESERDAALALVRQLVEALEELVDLSDAARAGDYDFDSYSCQPAREALAAAKVVLK